MKTQKSVSMRCGNLCYWIRREKSLARTAANLKDWRRKCSQNRIKDRRKSTCKLKSRVVLQRDLGLISKDNRPSVQGEGRAKPQPIVVESSGAHNMGGYYRSIPPKLPRTTRIDRTTAL